MRKGFTLIELLIVVTIIAILAGAAIPYVQEYMEDARISRCKSDLDEIKNALIRYEMDKGAAWPTAQTTITNLIGPYLAKALIDPWGSPYVINEACSVVYSAGPNRINLVIDSDNISVQFRPPLAMTKGYWIDADNTGTVNTGDQISLRYSRPIKTGINYRGNDFAFKVNGVTLAPAAVDATTNLISGRILQITLTTNTVGLFVPGRDTIITSSANLTDLAIAPYGPKTCLQNEVTIQALQ